MSRIWIADLVLAIGSPLLVSAVAMAVSSLESDADIYATPFYFVIPKTTAVPLAASFLTAGLWSRRSPANAARAQLIPLLMMGLYLAAFLYLSRLPPEL